MEVTPSVGGWAAIEGPNHRAAAQAIRIDLSDEQRKLGTAGEDANQGFRASQALDHVPAFYVKASQAIRKGSCGVASSRPYTQASASQRQLRPEAK